MKFTKRVDVKCSHQNKKVREVMDVLIDLIVGIISQYICISDHHIVHYTKLYVNHILKSSKY